MSRTRPLPDVLRIAAVQMEHGRDFNANLRRAHAHLERAREAGATIALLPEYFAGTLQPEGPAAEAARAAETRAWLADASRDLDLALVGNVVEADEKGALHNVGVAYADGSPVALQRKVHPMPREAECGIQGGHALEPFDLAGVPSGLLVCADVLYPEATRILALKGAQLLFNPVMSSFREVDPTKEAREMLYVARAYDSGAFVVKAGGFWKAESHAVAGRSLIASPWGMLARYRDDFAEEVLLADLDFAMLAKFREAQLRFPGRRPDAYGDLI